MINNLYVLYQPTHHREMTERQTRINVQLEKKIINKSKL